MSQVHKTTLDKDLYYYFNAKQEKRWMYQHYYYDNAGKRRKKKAQGFKSEKEAYKALLDVKAQTINGQTKQIEYSTMTIAQWFDIWLDTHKVDWAETTYIQREMIVRRAIKPYLGNHRLVDLDKTTYKREFINKLLGEVSDNTLALYHRIFKVAINAAVDDEIITRNRFTKITIQSSKNDPKQVKDNYFTAQELNQLLNAARDHENITNYTALLILTYTGIRKGECLGLKWRDVDLEQQTITIERTRDRYSIRPPKTNNSYRTILIDDTLTKHLEQYYKWCKQNAFKFGNKLQDDDFVLMSYQTGGPTGETSLLYALRRTINKADLKPITLHGLRHTHATILIGQNINVKVIADRLGNTPNMILDTYSHVFKELEEESVAAFNRSLSETNEMS